MQEVEHLVDDTCVITIDERRMPVLISTWRGQASVVLARAYFERIVRICERRGREKFVSVVDARAAKVPNAALTRTIGDEIAASVGATDAVLLGSVVVVDSALMRGALTAVQWAVRGDTRVVAVADFQAAFEVAAGLLRRAELAPPQDVSVPLYELPPHRSVS